MSISVGVNTRFKIIRGFTQIASWLVKVSGTLKTSRTRYYNYFDLYIFLDASSICSSLKKAVKDSVGFSID